MAETMTMAKALNAGLRRALEAAFRPALEGGYHLVEWMIWDSRVLRDPSGASHGLATVRAVIGGGA